MATTFAWWLQVTGLILWWIATDHLACLYAWLYRMICMGCSHTLVHLLLVCMTVCWFRYTCTMYDMIWYDLYMNAISDAGCEHPMNICILSCYIGFIFASVLICCFCSSFQYGHEFHWLQLYFWFSRQSAEPGDLLLLLNHLRHAYSVGSDHVSADHVQLWPCTALTMCGSDDVIIHLEHPSSQIYTTLQDHIE